MATPLAPLVRGPLLASSSHVPVSGALEAANVEILVGGTVVGSALSGSNGDLKVPLARSLGVGESVTARQSIAGATGPLSSQAVVVVAAPSPLPAPVFASPLTECMNRFLLAGLVPGSTVKVTIGATPVASFVATDTVEWAQVANTTPIAAGATMQAVQSIGAATSAATNSIPLAKILSRERFGPPRIAEPVNACDTAVLVSDVFPAGELALSNGGNTLTWTNVAATYWATGATPFKPGALKAIQRLPVCGGESAAREVTVGPPVQPPAPTVMPFCPETRRLLVGNLKPGGVLTVASRRVDGTGGETMLGIVGIGSTTQEIDLPTAVGGSGPAMLVSVRQTVCGLTSPEGKAVEFSRPEWGPIPPGPASIVAPLHDCMRAVPANGLTMVLTRATSKRSGQPLSDLVLVPGSSARIPTWFPLVAGDEVVIEQVGCSAPAYSAPERVEPLPSPLPVPTVRGPVRPGQNTVVVEGCLPGSRVHLLVDWQEVAATDQTWSGIATMQTPAPLLEGQSLWAVQTLCSAISAREGSAVKVQKGRLSTGVSPTPVSGGQAHNFTVTARDVDTGAIVAGRPVVLGGAVVGVTGSAFPWTPPGSGSSVTGTVQGGGSYLDATFTIGLVQAVKLILSLTDGPGIVPGRVSTSMPAWSVQPSWGAAAVTASGRSVALMIPPPPAPGATVNVSIDIDVTVEGKIFGIDWARETIKVAGFLTVVALTKPQHAAAFLLQMDTIENQKLETVLHPFIIRAGIA